MEKKCQVKNPVRFKKIFYIDVGKMSKSEANLCIRTMKNKFRKEYIYGNITEKNKRIVKFGKILHIDVEKMLKSEAILCIKTMINKFKKEYSYDIEKNKNIVNMDYFKKF